MISEHSNTSKLLDGCSSISLSTSSSSGVVEKLAKSKALFVYEAVDKRRISFHRRHIIGIIKKLDEGWCRKSVVTVTFKSVEGFFPFNQFAYSPSRNLRPVPDCGLKSMASCNHETDLKRRISFDRGDRISIIKKVDRGLGRGLVTTGRFKGMRGYFPAKYVKYAPPRDDKLVPDYGIRVIASSAYKAANERFISFDQGDIIGIIKKVKECWSYGIVIKGKSQGLLGLIPSCLVIPYDDVTSALPRDLTSVPHCGIRAIALLNYEPTHKGYLSFDRGDIISIIKKVDRGFSRGLVMTGRFAGSRGLIFAQHFMNAPHYDMKSVPECRIRVKALEDYKAADKREISFDKGDIISIIEKVDEFWWYGTVSTGKFKGLRGFFPYIYVRYRIPTYLDEDPAPQAAKQQQKQPAILPSDVPSCDSKNSVPRSPKQRPKKSAILTSDAPPRDLKSVPDCEIRAKALSSYKAVYETEISFDRGDIIHIIEKVGKGWFRGSVITGKFKGLSGLFPGNYVEELTTAKASDQRKRRKSGKKQKRKLGVTT